MIQLLCDRLMYPDKQPRLYVVFLLRRSSPHLNCPILMNFGALGMAISFFPFFLFFSFAGRKMGSQIVVLKSLTSTSLDMLHEVWLLLEHSASTMRAYNLAWLGLTTLSIAAPQFGLGEGSVILIPGGNSPINPSLTAPDIRPGKRQVSSHIPDFIRYHIPWETFHLLSSCLH